jgi:hypothetical protein
MVSSIAIQLSESSHDPDETDRAVDGWLGPWWLDTPYHQIDSSAAA